VKETLTKRQLKDVAERVLAAVKLRPSRHGSALADHFEISLPKDNLVLLANRQMEIQKGATVSAAPSPSRSKTQRASIVDEPPADRSGSMLEILYTTYTPADFVLRISDEADEGKILYQVRLPIAHLYLYMCVATPRAFFFPSPFHPLLLIPFTTPRRAAPHHQRTLPISVARSELYKNSNAMKENLTGIKKIIAVTDDPGKTSPSVAPLSCPREGGAEYTTRLCLHLGPRLLLPVAGVLQTR